MLNFLKEVAQLQKQYKRLVDSKKLTKKAMCELCVPFKDKYKLTDIQTLKIARQEVTIPDCISIYEQIVEAGVVSKGEKQ